METDETFPNRPPCAKRSRRSAGASPARAQARQKRCGRPTYANATVGYEYILVHRSLGVGGGARAPTCLGPMPRHAVYGRNVPCSALIFASLLGACLRLGLMARGFLACVTQPRFFGALLLALIPGACSPAIDACTEDWNGDGSLPNSGRLNPPAARPRSDRHRSRAAAGGT